MTYEQFVRERCNDDVSLLDGLETAWLWYLMAKVTETDPVERTYWSRLEKTAEEEIIKQQAKMIRRYM